MAGRTCNSIDLLAHVVQLLVNVRLVLDKKLAEEPLIEQGAPVELDRGHAPDQEEELKRVVEREPEEDDVCGSRDETRPRGCCDSQPRQQGEESGRPASVRENSRLTNEDLAQVERRKDNPVRQPLRVIALVGACQVGWGGSGLDSVVRRLPRRRQEERGR